MFFNVVFVLFVWFAVLCVGFCVSVTRRVSGSWLLFVVCVAWCRLFGLWRLLVFVGVAMCGFV